MGARGRGLPRGGLRRAARRGLVAGAPSTPLVLEFRDVVVRRAIDPTSPRRHLLDAVDWSVQPGEIWAVLGPNGAGKSTLLRVASGELAPTSGTVSILGGRRPGLRVPELRRRIAFAPSGSAVRFAAPYTVMEAVLTGATGTAALIREAVDDGHRRRAQQLVADFGLAHVSARRFDACSQGERARALLARAFLTDGELLLLDEPTAGLDLGGRELMLRGIDAAFRQKPLLAAAIATHHLEELPVGLTHALLLRDGAVVAAGPVDEALTEARLERCFGVRIEVERSGGRFFARAV